jgi:hypothetical protein
LQLLVPPPAEKRTWGFEAQITPAQFQSMRELVGRLP